MSLFQRESAFGQEAARRDRKRLLDEAGFDPTMTPAQALSEAHRQVQEARTASMQRQTREASLGRVRDVLSSAAEDEERLVVIDEILHDAGF